MRPDAQGLVQSWRGSVFWRVATVLLGVQLAAVAVAVGLSATAAYDRAMDLAAEGLRLRLDVVAEELEMRVEWSGGGLADLSAPLMADLSARFPDPLLIVNANGEPLLVARPDGTIEQPVISAEPPPDLAGAMLLGVIVASREEGWMAAPVYDEVGFLSGGIVIQPISQSLLRELEPARAALFRALAASGIVVLVLALVLAGAFTVGLVRPLQEMTRQVEAIGDGDYTRRVKFTGRDEFGRLADTINDMASRVSRSIEELQATDRMRRELVANVGHDLRTPLAGLVGRVDESRRMMQEGREEEASEQLAGAQRQAAYLKRLVDDLFELSMLDAPSPPLRTEPVPVAELVQDAAEQHRPKLSARKVRLELELEAELPIIEADGVRLMRVLSNLLSNADRHTPDEGLIQVRTWREDDDVFIQVGDSGPGLDPESREHLFERYYRGTDARTRMSDGTGLGLAISRAAALAHGGNLEADNREGGGAVFTLRLPVS